MTWESNIDYLIWLFTRSLSRPAAGRILSEIVETASLDVELPLTKEGWDTVLRWIDTHHPESYIRACKIPRPEGWIFDITTLEEELAKLQQTVLSHPS